MNPIIALIIANIIWGAAAPIFKFALENIPPFTLVFIRFFFSGLFFLPWAIKGWSSDIDIKDLFMICLSGFVGVTINVGFFFLGLGKTASINAPIISSAGPVFLYVISVIFFHEKAKKSVLSGMLISLLGVLVIILSPYLLGLPVFASGKQVSIVDQTIGNLFFVLATIGSVLHPITLKGVLQKVTVSVATSLSFLFGAMTVLPFMLFELKSWHFMQLNHQGITGIIFGVFFSSTIAYSLFSYGIKKIKMQEVGIFTYIDPVIAVIIAIPLIHEYPTPLFFIGSILVIGGIYIAEKRIHWHPFFWKHK